LKADQTTTYSKTDVDNKFTSLISGAPATLNTLNEIATALGDDANLAATLTTSIGQKSAIGSCYTTSQADGLLILKANETDLVISNATITTLNTKVNTLSGNIDADIVSINGQIAGINNVITSNVQQIGLLAPTDYPSFTGTVGKGQWQRVLLRNHH
jgi:hypothetical protein